MTNIEKARERCKMAMKEVGNIDDVDTRFSFELHLQHIHAALGGSKDDLYEYTEAYRDL